MLAYKEKIKIRNGKINILLPPELNDKDAEMIILLYDPLEVKENNTSLHNKQMEGIILPGIKKREAKIPAIRAKGSDMADMVIEDRR